MLQVIERMHMTKGRVRWQANGDTVGKAYFVAGLLVSSPEPQISCHTSAYGTFMPTAEVRNGTAHTSVQ